MIDIQEKKRKIISFLENNGPSLPVRIAKAIEMDPVFASAILSELLGTKEVKMSHLRVGASSLYLLPGQEERISEQIEHLKPIEKEAYLKLKKRKLLTDEDEEPATRVALRNLRDFASPFKFKEKIMWQYTFATDEEIQELLNPPMKEEVKKETENNALEKAPEAKKEENVEEVVPKAWEAKKEEIKKAKEETSPKGKEKKEIESIFEAEDETPSLQFLSEVKEFLQKRKMEFIEEIQSDKKEIAAKASLKTPIGNLTFLIIAKNKKSVTMDELNSALQRANYDKMPCLYLIRREPPKKILDFLNSNNLIKLEIME